MFLRDLLLPVVAVALLGACVPSSSRRPAVPAPETSPTTRVPNVAGPWVLRPPSASEEISIATMAVVAISGDGAARTDTLHATLSASFAWSPGGHHRVDGLLRGYSMQLGAGVASVPAGLRLLRPFTADTPLPGGSLTFRLPSETSACDDPALSVLQGLHDAWIRLPDTLFVTREWTDTAHTLSCRDHVLLHGTVVRRFRVLRAELEAGGRLVVLIDRTSKGRLSGDGEQFGEHVMIEGESSGALRYVVDPLIGRSIRAAGESALTFKLKSARRNQTVRQESALTLTWAQ